MCAAPGSKTAQLIEMLHADMDVPFPGDRNTFKIEKQNLKIPVSPSGTCELKKHSSTYQRAL